VSGTIRREDIASDNTVKSTSVADATIRLESSGSVADAAKRGWFGRIIDWVNPF
jgi:flagellar L-ring protein precursor FlgH